MTFKPDFGPLQEYFLGTGGVYNLYTALTEEKLPGRAKAIAKVGALGIWVMQMLENLGDRRKEIHRLPFLHLHTSHAPTPP